MGIRTSYNIKIISSRGKTTQSGSGGSLNIQQIKEQKLEELLTLPSTNIPTKSLSVGVNKNQYKGELRDIVSRDDLIYYLKVAIKQIKNKNDNGVYEFREFFRLFDNKSGKRADNDKKILQYPHLLKYALDRNLITSKKATKRTYYSLTAAGKNTALLASANPPIPYKQDYLPTKYLHPVDEYQKKFIDFGGERIIIGVRNRMNQPVITFADLKPVKTRTKNNKYYMDKKTAELERKLLVNYLQEFHDKPLVGAHPVLYYPRTYKGGNVLLYTQNGNRGGFAKVNATTLGYFYKNYGDDIEFSMLEDELIAALDVDKKKGQSSWNYKNSILVHRGSDILGFFRVDIEEDNLPITRWAGTRGVGTGYYQMPAAAAYDLWRHWKYI